MCLPFFQFSAVTQLCLTLCNPIDCSTPGFPVHHQLQELTQTHVQPSVMLSNHLILCHLLSSCLQPFPASGSFLMSQLFTSGGHKSFSFSISPSNEYSGLMSFRFDWIDLLAVQGTLKNLLQHRSISFSGLNFLYSPTLTFIHDYWKSHSFGICWQSDVSAF